METMRGRTAIVTSASRGIGLATAAALVARGASVCITARDRTALDQAAASLDAPDRVLAVAGDTADAEHREAAVTTALERFGSVDMLVSNTGVCDAWGELLDAPLDAVRSTYDTNVVSALGWIGEVHRSWMGRHGGSIVNVASVAGLRPAAKIGVYSITKAALIHLTTHLALELGANVRVNGVAPAVVRTRFAAALYEDREAEVARTYPLGRFGEPADVASAIAFLLSDEASWMTGETLVVDGGLLASSVIDDPMP